MTPTLPAVASPRWRLVRDLSVGVLVALLCVVASEWFGLDVHSGAALSLVSAATFVLLPLLEKWVARAAVLLVGTAFAFVVTLGVEHLSIRTMQTDTYAAIFQTTLREALEFLTTDTATLHRVWMSSVAAFVLLLGAVIARSIKPTRPERGRDRTLSALIVLGVGAGPAVGVLPQLIETRRVELRDAADWFAIEKKKFELANAEFAKAPDVQRTSTIQPDVIVVIGESISRHHFSLYGYPRATNTALEKWRQGLVRFDDVISNHSHTAPSLTRVLSRNISLDGTPENGEVSLVAALQAGGYRVAWLSNQNEFGAWDNPVTRHAKLADRYRFIRKTVGKVFQTDTFDHELLGILQDEFAVTAEDARPQFYFVHTYAGHVGYCENIPASARKQWLDTIAALPREALFGNSLGMKDELDCYDSAIAYGSENLADVLSLVSARQRPTILFYFSDHGENVLDLSRHESSLHSHMHLDVPFLMYFNDRARQVHARLLHAAMKTRSARFELADFFPTAMEVAQLRSDRIKESAVSMFRDPGPGRARVSLIRDNSFVAVDQPVAVPGKRNVADHAWQARYELNKLKRSERRKTCGHRANTFFKAYEALRTFECVEVDVVIDDDEMWIFHPPAANPRLPLSAVLPIVDRQQRLWLDVKNLTADRLPRLIEYLEANGWGQRRSSLLIETSFLPSHPEDVRLFRRYAAAGWNFSYYLPTDEGLRCAKASPSERCSARADKIRDSALRARFNHLSFDARLWGFVENSSLRSGFRLGTWDMSPTALADARESALFQRADWFIVQFPSPYYH